VYFCVLETHDEGGSRIVQTGKIVRVR